MRGSTLYQEIEMAIQRIYALAQRPGRGPNAGVADARLHDRFLYLPVAPKDYAKKTEELDDLFQAVADLRPLKCRYLSAHRGAEETILIHPYALVLYKDALYCVGYHTGRDEIRTFALDRMRDTKTSTLERFALPEDFHVEDYFQGEFGIWRSTKKHKVVVDFDAKVAELVRSRRVHATQKLKELPGKGVRLTMTVGDLREVTSWLLGWGATAKVVEPEELVERMREELEGALAKYRDVETVTAVRGKQRA
jgi:predicted DNA-binding transcriptional regulator YafY